MNTAIINVKVERSFKSQVQKLADELGLSVSALIIGLLKHALRTKTIIFSTSKKLNSAYMNAVLKEVVESEKEV